MACSNVLGGVVHRTLFLKFTLSIEAPQQATDLSWQAQRPNTGDIGKLYLKAPALLCSPIANTRRQKYDGYLLIRKRYLFINTIYNNRVIE